MPDHAVRARPTGDHSRQPNDPAKPSPHPVVPAAWNQPPRALADANASGPAKRQPRHVHPARENNQTRHSREKRGHAGHRKPVRHGTGAPCENALDCQDLSARTASDVVSDFDAMTPRLLSASFLLVLGFNVQAAMDRVHSASGDAAGPTCPPATLTEPDDAAPVKPDTASPAAVKSSAPPASSNPAMPRPGLRWHSFLPGMMK